MDTNEDVRRRRLEHLCNEHGGVRAVASQAKLNWQSLDQIIKKVPLPEKKNGDRSPRALGGDAARKLEEAFDLGQGWFDWPFEHVAFKEWAALDPYQRVLVEGKLSTFIAEAAKMKVPSGLKKRAVSDKTVEKHLPALPQGEAKAAYERASRRSSTAIPLTREPDLFTPGRKGAR